MHFRVFTLFPEAFSALDCGLVGKARETGIIRLELFDIRQHSGNKHGKVDDAPYGGGPGMVMRPEPVFESVEAAYGESAGELRQRNQTIVLLTPQGRPFDDAMARRLATRPDIGLICGHYEGVDDRVRRGLVSEEISIGDYILTGGELPAMILIDAVSRFLPGVIGNAESVDSDTFSNGILKGPQYTRPRSYRGMDVPDILLNGDHARIEAWRNSEARQRTSDVRPDLIPKGEEG